MIQNITLKFFLVLVLLSTGYLANSQVVGEYQSAGSGPWNAAGTWQVYDGAMFIAAGAAPTGIEPIITIRAGHNVTMPTAGNPVFTISSQLDIQATGTLTVATTAAPALTKLTLTGVINNLGLINITGGGVLQVGINVNGGTVINGGAINSTAAKLIFGAASIYEHNFTAAAGTIPTASWNPTSTCLITASNDLAPSGLGQSFGNFEWNYPTQSVFVDLAGALTTVNGDLRLVTNQFSGVTLNGAGGTYTLNIGGSLYCYEYFELNSLSGTTTVNITNDFIMDDPSGTFSGYLVLNAGSGQTNIFIGGDLTIDNSAGGFSAVDMSFGGAGSTSIFLEGNYTVQNGAFLTSGFGAGLYDLTFNGLSEQQVIESLSLDGIDIIINDNATVLVDNENFLGTDGAFSLGDAATLRVGSSSAGGAIQNGATGGNLQVSGTRLFSPTSIVEYVGANQFMGSGHPSGAGTTIINNSSGNTTLANDVVIGGTLILTSGNLALSNRTLTLNGSLVPNANSLALLSSSSISIGGTGAFGTLATTGSTTINNFTINRLSGGTVTLGSDLTIGGTFTQTQGDIVLNGRTLTISGPYTRTNGSFSIDAASNVVINGSGSLPTEIAFSGSQVLNTLTISRSSSTVGTSSSFTVTNLNLLAGTFDNTGTITMATSGVLTRTEGSIINNTPQAVTSYDIIYNVATNISTGSEIPSLTSELRHVTKTGAATVTLTQPITINGDLTFTNGIFDAGSNAIDLKGNLVANSTSILTSNTMTFSGTTGISGGALVRFGNVTITGSVTPSVNIRIDGNLVNNGTLASGSGAQTFTFGGNTAISGSSISSFNNVTISGTLTAPTGNFNVAGNWVNNGTFNRGASTNTITFNGTTSVSGSSATTFSGITISGTLNSPTTLTLAGNWTNNGVFNRGTGTVVFAGSSTQNIQGSSATTFNNMTVTNVSGPPGARVVTNQNLAGVLTLSSGVTFDADGASGTSIFTLLSSADDPTQDGAVAILPGGSSVTGNVTVQRYMSIEGGSNSPSNNNGRIYRYISSPVQNPAVSQIQSEIPVTGSFTGSSSCSGCGSGQSMFAYDETITTGDLNTGYVDFPVSANSETMTNGRGYTLFIRADVNPILSAGSALWDVRAPINSGTINLNSFVTYTSSGNNANDGWSLVGNPYPSTIDWDAVSGWTRTGINNATYMLDNGLASPVYATYISGVGLNGGSRHIAIGQAFWVKSDGGPIDFQMNENVKVAGTQTTFLKEGAINDLLKIALKSDGISDEAAIRFHELATEGFDSSLDAYKFKNPGTINLSSTSTAGLELAVNALPTLQCTTTINLTLENLAEGTHTLEFTSLESFSSPTGIILTDHYLSQQFDLKENSVIDFSITDDPESVTGRFSISFVNELGDPDLKVSATADPSCKQGPVTIEATGAPVGGGYRWYENETDNLPIASQTASTFVTPELDKSRTFYVSAYNAEGCEGPRLSVVAEVVNFDEVLISENDSELVSSYIKGNQWFKDGVLITGATDQTIKPAESGVYSVEVTVGSCKTSAERVFTVTSVDEENLFDQIFSVFPNPVEQAIHLKSKVTFPLQPVLVDQQGKKVGEFKMHKSGDLQIGELDMRSAAAGVYILQITGEDGKVLNKRIVKQ